MRLTALTFLFLLCTAPLLAQPLTVAEETEARQLFVALGCQACHDFDKSGSKLAASLDRIGLRLDEAQILERLQRTPRQAAAAEPFMPSYSSTPLAQLKLLSRFLAGRR